MTVLEAALAYAARGWSVIPLRPRDKRPALQSWQEYQQRRATEEEIRTWWHTWPNANVGVVTGAVSGLVVLDLDGPEAVAFAKERGVPQTPVAATGKGFHVYFAHPGRPVANVASLGGIKGLDIRGDGGYVVAPPSVHPSGRTYMWTENYPLSLPLAPPLPWLVELLETRGQAAPAGAADGPGKEPGWVEALLAGVDEGQRDDACTRLAGYFLAKGLVENEVLALLLAWNQRNRPPLPERDIEKCVRSVARREARKPKRARNGTLWEPDIVCLTTVEPETVEWLLEPYIPLGKLTALEGDPGAGKTWVALALCARVTRQGRNVLYLTAEDGLADTIRPRAEACGVNLDKFFVLRGQMNEDGAEMPFTLAHPEVLEEAIRRSQPALVVLDPIQGFIGAEVDMHRANEVRVRLSLLVRLAEQYRCAIIIIRHLAKTPTAKAIYRGLGSIDFTAAVRSQLIVGRTQDGQRVLAHAKSNLGEEGPSLGFVIDKGQFLWTGEVAVTADEIARPEEPDDEKSALEEATEWLREVLADGPVETKEIYRSARHAGIAQRTLERAKAKLGVKARRIGTPGQRGGGTWCWCLPSDLDRQIDGENDGPSLRVHVGGLNQNPQSQTPQGIPATDLDRHMVILIESPQAQERRGIPATDLDRQKEPLREENLDGQLNPTIDEEAGEL